MTTTTQYRYYLDTSSKKFTCPSCNKKELVLYKDHETDTYINDEVGKCDRLKRCTYHLPPKEYFESNGIKRDFKPFINTKTEVEIKPVDFMPFHFVEATVNPKLYPKNNLHKFLSTLFSPTVANNIFNKYLIGTSTKMWKGANVYWQIDEKGNARQCKIMLHDSGTGKRVKTGAEVEKYNRYTKSFIKEITEEHCSKVYGKFLDASTRLLNLEQCFFGQHLLTEHPNHKVCIVESEKTAIIASVFMPNMVWLATGGVSGCRWREYAIYKSLENRHVTYFPDYGIFSKGKTCFEEWSERVARITEAIKGQFIVSDLLERTLKNVERRDQDIADLLIKRDSNTGIALTENNYPVIWDLNKK